MVYAIFMILTYIDVCDIDYFCDCNDSNYLL